MPFAAVPFPVIVPFLCVSTPMVFAHEHLVSLDDACVCGHPLLTQENMHFFCRNQLKTARACDFASDRAAARSRAETILVECVPTANLKSSAEANSSVPNTLTPSRIRLFVGKRRSFGTQPPAEVRSVSYWQKSATAQHTAEIDNNSGNRSTHSNTSVSRSVRFVWPRRGTSTRP